jgi:hypothetical protein
MGKQDIPEEWYGDEGGLGYVDIGLGMKLSELLPLARDIYIYI